MDRLAKGASGRMGRREFIGAAAALLGAAALAGCGDETTGSGDGSREGMVGNSDNHTHKVVITKEQLDAGEAVTLTLTGNGHTHTVDLTAAEVQGLKAKTAHLMKTSSTTASHSHDVHLY